MTIDITALIGTEIKARRRVLGMSQTKLGDQIGITFQQVQKYEKGVNKISISKLEKIGKALGFNLGEFLNEIYMRVEYRLEYRLRDQEHQTVYLTGNLTNESYTGHIVAKHLGIDYNDLMHHRVSVVY